MIEEFCSIHGITEDQFYGREVIDHYLNLQYETSIPDGFNPIMEELSLRNLKEMPNTQFSPIVSGWLALPLITKLPDNFNFSPIVNGWLDLEGLLRIPMDGQFNPQADIIFLNKNIICGNLICEESVKKSLKLMLQSNDKELVNLAFSMLWKYRIEDIKELNSICKNRKIIFR